MFSSLARRVVTVLLAQSLLLSTTFAQQQTPAETRPRRAQPAWPQPSAATPIISSPNLAVVTGPEPRIRVALSTDSRSAVISTTGHLMNASGGSSTLLALDSSRVRVDPRLLSPSAKVDDDDGYRVIVAGATSHDEADDMGKEIEKLVGEDTDETFDTETKTWGVAVGSKRSREEAEELSARLEAAGFNASVQGEGNLKQSEEVTKNSSSQRAKDSSSQREEVTKNSSPQRAKNSSSQRAEVAKNSSSQRAEVTKNSSSQRAEVAKNSSSQRPPTSGAAGTVRLASLATLPSRELVATPTAGPVFSSSAPVVFASDDEKNAPVRFNDRPYRGRIEVFTNLRGSLTVVNELGLEDYVRGVVANELSPGGYPAIEALKAQAIAARTYALKNRGQFMAQGFDILPTTRSQVYRGLTSEHALSTRAVDETRGIVATFAGEPINALYTSTCGGRTENSENIFNDAIPYLRGRECAAEGHAAFDRFVIRTTRTPADLRNDEHVALARDISLLLTQNFATLPDRISDSWLAADATVAEVRNLIANVARVAKQTMPATGDDLNRPPAFATALATAVFGDDRPSTLLNNADADYILAVRDAQDVPVPNRADLAMLVRDGYLSAYPDATLRPRQPLSRARVLHAIARLLEGRNLLQLQKANARPASEGQLILRSSKGKDQPIRVNPDAFLFRQLGELPYAVSSVTLVGGEPVTYHLAPNGAIDFLEVKPAPNGAAADRMSPFSSWTKNLSLAQVQARLARPARGIGQIVDLRVVSRGSSHRATDLEIVGTNGTAHVRGGRIRSALGLREQLFVIDREYDETGRVTDFVFSGRGWGHGVGMCQVGAYGLAKQGWTVEQILKAYYTGIELTRLY